VAVTTFFLGMPVALAPPILQAVTPNQLRGQVTSIYLLLINLIGLGLGPFLVAFFTDFVFHDEKLVGLSLGLVSALAALLSVLCLASAIGPYRRLVAAMEGRA
jgi:MFS family permease